MFTYKHTPLVIIMLLAPALTAMDYVQLEERQSEHETPIAISQHTSTDTATNAAEVEATAAPLIKNKSKWFCSLWIIALALAPQLGSAISSSIAASQTPHYIETESRQLHRPETFSLENCDYAQIPCIPAEREFLAELCRNNDTAPQKDKRRRRPRTSTYEMKNKPTTCLGACKSLPDEQLAPCLQQACDEKSVDITACKDFIKNTQGGADAIEASQVWSFVGIFTTLISHIARGC